MSKRTAADVAAGGIDRIARVVEGLSPVVVMVLPQFYDLLERGIDELGRATDVAEAVAKHHGWIELDDEGEDDG